MLSLEKILVSSVLFSVLLAGCSSSTGGGSLVTTPPTQPDTSTTLTAPPGPLEGVVLVIPANAVPDGTVITLDSGIVTAIPGRRAVGPVATFGPSGTTFSPAAMLTLPFTPESGPVIEILEDIMIAVRDDTTGEVVEVEPLSIDQESGLADLDLDHFSSCWVTALELPPPPTGDIVLADYFLLNIGDIYQYQEDGGTSILTMLVEAMPPNPNVPGAQFRMTFIGEGETDGEYFSLAANGDLISHGFFSETDNEEDVFVTPLMFAPGVMTPGTSIAGETDVNFHAPIGSPEVLFTSHLMVESFFGVEILAEMVSTPAGEFDDVFFIGRIENEISGPNTFQDETLLALARGVGLIGFEFDEDDETRLFLLRGAVVGGVAIGEPINTDF